MTEIWRTIRRYPEYEVSSMGHVRRRIAGAGGAKAGKVLRPWRNAGRYHHVALRKRSISVHRLVLETFVGPCPDGQQARHVNGDMWDNRLANLMWGTAQANAEDRNRHGNTRRGREVNTAKLTAAQVVEIRGQYATGSVTQYGLAEDYGVSQAAIHAIVHRQSWAHV